MSLLDALRPPCAYCEDPTVFDTYSACPLCSRRAPDTEPEEAERLPVRASADWPLWSRRGERRSDPTPPTSPREDLP